MRTVSIRWNISRMKIAAIEGHWENPPGEATPLVLFGVPDMDAEKTKYSLEIPYLGSLILTHSLDKQVPALKSFPKEDRPNSTIIFWSFRIMAGLGMLMILTGVASAWLRWRGHCISVVLSCGSYSAWGHQD